mmetsp:Transcript_35205/g.90477  ORF Transcript_35205/g.90477 Transcript_35205/m.90477 type:complete len:352 (-) Transcript_35205:189-1244(-)
MPPEDPEVTHKVSQRRRLCDVLWLAQPKWEPKDLQVAEKKLAMVGIITVAALADVLAKRDLSRQLRQAGVQTFRAETREAFEVQARKSLDNPDLRLPGAALGSHRNESISPKRLLCEVLWASRPRWMPVDLVRAERKLAQVGVEELPALDEELENLNQLLRKAGLKAFGSDTLAALREHLDQACGADKQAARTRSGAPRTVPVVRDLLSEYRTAPAANAAPRDLPGEGEPSPRASEPAAAAAERKQAKEPRAAPAVNPVLRELLWETRPAWSPSELAAVERKLAQVRVTSVPELREALREGLNDRLRQAGQRPMLSETVRELQRRLGQSHAVPPSVPATPRSGVGVPPTPR